MGLLSTKELAKRLRVSIGTVYRMVDAGRIPAIRIGTGRNLRFDFDEVCKAMAKGPPARVGIPKRGGTDPLLTIHQLAVATGIKDLAQNHDHYLYGVPIR